MVTERSFYEHLGRSIRTARAARGWSQLRLAMKLGFSTGVTVHHWEVGDNRPRAWVLYELDRIFGAGWR